MWLQYVCMPMSLFVWFLCLSVSLSICLPVFSLYHLIVLKLKFLPCRDSNASTTNEKNAGLCLAMAAKVPMLAIKFTLRQMTVFSITQLHQNLEQSSYKVMFSYLEMFGDATKLRSASSVVPPSSRSWVMLKRGWLRGI